MSHGCHAFADTLQLKETVQEHCESMQILLSRHAFAVTNAGRRSRKLSAKAWHPAPHAGANATPLALARELRSGNGTRFEIIISYFLVPLRHALDHCVGTPRSRS